jgi:hypothetical protein
MRMVQTVFFAKFMRGQERRGAIAVGYRARHEGPMVEKLETSSCKVVDLAAFRERNGGAKVGPMAFRLCRHCGAVLADGEHEDECSSTFNVEAAQLRWQAAQILRGLI